MTVKEKEYALYKGDEFLVVGTIEEIAEHQSLSVESVKHLGMPSYLKRVKARASDNYKVLIEVE